MEAGVLQIKLSTILMCIILSLIYLCSSSVSICLNFIINYIIIYISECKYITPYILPLKKIDILHHLLLVTKEYEISNFAWFRLAKIEAFIFTLSADFTNF